MPNWHCNVQQSLPVCVSSVPSRNKRRRTLVPITPLPHYSDMDTPELKTKLTRWGLLSALTLKKGWIRGQICFSLIKAIKVGAYPLTSHGVTARLVCLAVSSHLSDSYFLHCAGLVFGLYQSARWSSNWRRSTSTRTSWSAPRRRRRRRAPRLRRSPLPPLQPPAASKCSSKSPKRPLLSPLWKPAERRRSFCRPPRAPTPPPPPPARSPRGTRSPPVCGCDDMFRWLKQYFVNSYSIWHHP